MSETKLYRPEEDDRYSRPYIDVEEWREKPLKHYYVHGGFKGTEKDGVEAKFCFYFPVKEKYEGRFFQYVSPAPENECACEQLSGEDDKIAFALTHGAYFVVSNQGGVIGDGERLYATSSNTARYGRELAQKIYDCKDRPYGYIFGGSGGSFKTMSCMEITEGVWDGAVPYVIGNPMATPNVFCTRMKAMRVLGEEGLKKVVDAMDPGGSGNIYEGLNKEQKEALEEASKMGYPDRGWFCYPYMGDGALSVLMPTVYRVYPEYFKDFWTKEGYEGSNPESTEAKARIQFVTTVSELIEKEPPKTDELNSSVDTSWINTLVGNDRTPKIKPSALPPEGSYLFHCRLRVLSGKAKGKEGMIDNLDGGIITMSSAFDGSVGNNALEGIAVGDEIMIDNSDYLAIQSLQRHQVPDGTYKVYDIYKDKDGKPVYPQLPMLIAPMIASGGGGCLQTGNIHGKMIAVCSLLDESAYAWHGDWYREAIKRTKGNEDDFRLYYNDNCIHDDRAGYLDNKQRQVDYLGILHQALLDVAQWVEKGKEPLPTTNYTFKDGQIIVPETAKERCGLQPVVKALVNGEKCVTVNVGEEVVFTSRIDTPTGGGFVTEAAWDFEKSDDFTHTEKLTLLENGTSAQTKTTHIFNKPGVYFPVIKVKSSRNGSLDDIFVQCKNLDRVKVVVK